VRKFKIRVGKVGATVIFVGGLALLSLAIPSLLPSRPPVVADPAIRAQLERTLTGPADHVWQVAFSPDGSLLAACSVDSTVTLWSVADGAARRTATAPAGLTSIAFSPDGLHLAVGSYDRTVRIWSVPGLALEKALEGHAGTVWSVAFSPDGTTLASSGEDKTIRLWRVADGTTLRTLSGHALNVWSVAFSPDGAWLASGSFDHTAKLWRVADGSLARTLSGHEQAIVELAFSPDSTLLATGSDDSTVRLWNVSDGTLARTLHGKSEHVYAVEFSPDGRWLASGSRARTAVGTLLAQVFGDALALGRRASLRLWDVRDGTLHQALDANVGDVHTVAFSPDGHWLATAGDERAVELWRLTGPASTP